MRHSSGAGLAARPRGAHSYEPAPPDPSGGYHSLLGRDARPLQTPLTVANPFFLCFFVGIGTFTGRPNSLRGIPPLPAEFPPGGTTHCWGKTHTHGRPPSPLPAESPPGGTTHCGGIGP